MAEFIIGVLVGFALCRYQAKKEGDQDGQV